MTTTAMTTMTTTTHNSPVVRLFGTQTSTRLTRLTMM